LQKIFIVMLLTISILLGCGTAEQQGGTIDIERLDEYVTDEKVERRMASLQQIDPKLTPEDAQSTAIQKIIDEYILFYEAKAKELSVSEEEIQDVIEFNIETASQVQDERFNSILEEVGMTIEEYYRDYAYDSIKEKLLENKLHDEIVSQDQMPEKQVEVWNEYKKELINHFRQDHETEINQLITTLLE
jgi:hypothetical protein